MHVCGCMQKPVFDAFTFINPLGLAPGLMAHPFSAVVRANVQNLMHFILDRNITQAQRLCVQYILLPYIITL